MMKSLVGLLLIVSLALRHSVCLAYTPSLPVSRRNVLVTSFSRAASALAVVVVASQPPPAVMAFEGTGSSAYAGRSPATKAELQKSYKIRIAADVKDFNALGKAIDAGKLRGDEWVNFYIQFARREPDAVGRTYAALADIVGTKDGGGCGLLLAASFAKPNKPPDNVPAVKKFNALLKAFDPIQVVAEQGDAKRAQKEWQKASVLLSDYLESVELPADLNDPMYR